MAQKEKGAKVPAEPRRLNRVVGAGEALGRVLDEALRRRGFASRDLITNWRAMAPKPWDELARPDRLAWPRGARGTEGATLYLRCAPGQQLALAHEGQAIAATINRYFGYVLVGAVRMSAEPLVPEAQGRARAPAEPDAETGARIEKTVANVEDEGVRAALRGLGRKLTARNET